MREILPAFVAFRQYLTYLRSSQTSMWFNFRSHYVYNKKKIAIFINNPIQEDNTRSVLSEEKITELNLWPNLGFLPNNYY